MNYSELRPDQLAAQLARCPVAVVPWGALEWHSDHLPVGLDGLVATGVAAALAERLGAVVLPPLYLPITPLPHQFSLGFSAATVALVLDELLLELQRVGYRCVVILSGHYAQGHELVLIDAATRALDRGLAVLALPPLALLGPQYLDHAGQWETSLLLALRPDLVDAARQATVAAAPDAVAVGVLGQLPGSATAAAGQAAIAAALDALQEIIVPALAGDHAPLRALYAARRAEYADFLARFFRGSWEDAAAAWWAARTAPPAP